MSTYNTVEEVDSSMDQSALRLAGALLLGGQLLYILITQFHTGGDANDHPSIFAKYAGSGDWKGVHAGQFAAMAIVVAGLIALCFAVHMQAPVASWTARMGAVLAVVALGLYGVLQAVDGIGNKEVDRAWVNASPAQKTARFASAEAMRWLEWGVRSYHDYALGLALLLLGAAVLAVPVLVIPRPVGYLMGLSGAAYLVQGWVVGSQGFSNTDSTLILIAWAFSLAWMIWLAAVTWRTQSSTIPRQAG